MKEVLRVYWFLLFLFLVTSLAHGQVRRDSASRIRFGNVLPATCNPNIGQVFFLIAPGTPLGLHQCLTTDTFVPGGSGTVTGTGVDEQVAFFVNTDEISSSANFTFDDPDIIVGGNVSALNLNLINDTAFIRMGASLDAQIHRGDGADIVEQRRGLNSQKWNIYDNFVSFADYDRLGIYIGGGPPVLTAIFRPETTDGTQGINVLIESVSNAFGEGNVTLLAGTSGASLLLQPSSGASSAQFTGGGVVTFSNDIRLVGLIASVGLTESSPGVGLFMTIASQGGGFADSHSIDLLGKGSGASSATWRTFVDILNIGADSIYTLQVGPTGGPFVDVLTIDDGSDVVIADSAMTLNGPLASYTVLSSQGSTPITGLNLDSVDLTSVGQRDSDSLILTGKAHDGGTFRNTRWSLFVDVTNNSGASTLRLQHSAATNPFSDFLTIDTTGELSLIPGSGRFSFGSSPTVSLLNDDLEAGELGQRSGTTAQIYNLYNTFTSSSNNELAEIGWVPVSNTFVVGTKKGASGGTARPMVLRTDETTAITISTAQLVTFADAIQQADGQRWALLNVEGSSTVPNIIPNRTHTDSGISLVDDEGADDFHIVTEGTSVLNIGLAEAIITSTSFVVSGAGPHAIAGAAFGAVQLLISDTFTSDGASDIAAGLFHTPTIVGFAGDTTSLNGSTFTAAITTQTATESIANISQIQINEPSITDNLTGSITNAQSLLISGVPTEGDTNDAMRITAGSASFADGSASIPGVRFASDTDTGIYFNGGDDSMLVTVDGASKFIFTDSTGDGRFGLSSDSLLGWCSGAAQGCGLQFVLGREAPDVGGAPTGDLFLSNSNYSVYQSRVGTTEYTRTSVRIPTETLASVTGASVSTAAGFIPDGALVLGVTTEVSVALGTSGGTTGYEVGEGGDATRWGSITGTSTATFSDNADFTNSAVEIFTAADVVVITAIGGNFDGTGSIIVNLHYIEVGNRK